MERPLVSVVVPMYNSARFLREAVESVLSQTYDRWELLLVDDGSTDASMEIAESFAAKHPGRITVLEHPGHKGLPASRNLGIAHARGEFVAGLDSDDVWLPRRLERHVEIALDHPEVGMVCGPSWWWFSWTGAAGDADLDMRRELKVEYDRRYDPPELLSSLLLAEMHSPTTNAMLIRRSVLTGVGGYAEDFQDFGEDQVVVSKLLIDTPVFVTGEALDRYRQHSDSITAQAGSSITDVYVPMSPERKAFLEWVAGYTATLERPSDQVEEALDAALKPYQHLWRYRLSHPSELSRWAASKLLPTSWQRALWRSVRRHRTPPANTETR